MRNAEKTAEVRALTDAELDGVAGGHPALIMAGLFATGLMAGLYWDLPPGTSVQQAAAALGVEHLL